MEINPLKMVIGGVITLMHAVLSHHEIPLQIPVSMTTACLQLQESLREQLCFPVLNMSHLLLLLLRSVSMCTQLKCFCVCRRTSWWKNTGTNIYSGETVCSNFGHSSQLCATRTYCWMMVRDIIWLHFKKVCDVILLFHDRKVCQNWSGPRPPPCCTQLVWMASRVCGMLAMERLKLCWLVMAETAVCWTLMSHGEHLIETPSTGLQHPSSNHCHTWLCHRSLKTVS